MYAKIFKHCEKTERISWHNIFFLNEGFSMLMCSICHFIIIIIFSRELISINTSGPIIYSMRSYLALFLRQFDSGGGGGGRLRNGLLTTHLTRPYVGPCQQACHHSSGRSFRPGAPPRAVVLGPTRN